MITGRTPAAQPTKHLRAETIARGLALLVLIGLPAVVLLLWIQRHVSSTGDPIEIHARMPEIGGWSPGDLTVTAGEPLHLRLISDDVLHGFKIGQSEVPAIDLTPGKPVETTLTFEQPGKYTFYCTRWCGLNHWRMRGTIQVLPAEGAPSQPKEGATVTPPLYVRLGLDLDAPHPAEVIPVSKPSVARAASLNIDIPTAYLNQPYYRSHSPAQIWEAMRSDPVTEGLTDQQVWDLVASIWDSNTNAARLAEGKALYAQNCAACHGENGVGDGVMADEIARQMSAAGAQNGAGTGMDGHSLQAPANFTEAANLLGASPALLQGKILRGGMGTGMPYWGPIFTEEQVWAIVDYLWTFQFEPEVEP